MQNKIKPPQSKYFEGSKETSCKFSKEFWSSELATRY